MHRPNPLRIWHFINEFIFSDIWQRFYPIRLWFRSNYLPHHRLIGSLLSLLKILPLEVKIVELIVHELNLFMGKRKSFSVDQALDSVKLVHDNKVRVVVAKFYSPNVVSEQLVVQLIMASLLQSKVQNTTEDLE